MNYAMLFAHVTGQSPTLDERQPFKTN